MLRNTILIRILTSTGIKYCLLTPKYSSLKGDYHNSLKQANLDENESQTLEFQMLSNTVMHCLMIGTSSEKCVRGVHHVNVVECTYTSRDGLTYYTARLYGLAYCSIGEEK